MTARSHEPTAEESQPNKPGGRATDDELREQMRSALEDVYEALLVVGGNETEEAWAGVVLVNDLAH